MKLKIGISPCPNDTFIFDGIFNKSIDLAPFEFEFIFEDVQTLNLLASDGQIDIIKLSYAHFFNVLETYQMLRSGSALGFGVGPLLISNKTIKLNKIEFSKIAIPGKFTTANFLLKFAFPNVTHLIEMPFSEIEQAISMHQVDAGVIIHENRFTYQEKGLSLIQDLGTYWETKTHLPIPLGGIAIKRSFDIETKHQINELICQSILNSQSHYPNISNFVANHAQEMEKSVMRKHIDLYVNEYSVDIQEKGIEAVTKMQEILYPNSTYPLFID